MLFIVGGQAYTSSEDHRVSNPPSRLVGVTTLILSRVFLGKLFYYFVATRVKPMHFCFLLYFYVQSLVIAVSRKYCN